MNAKDKAIEIIESFRDGVLELTLFNDKEVLVKCAIIHVRGIIDVTKPDPYPRKKTQMDREYWQEVLTELNQM